MTRADLLALALRVECEEPSRELDLAVSVAVNFKDAFRVTKDGEQYAFGAGGDEIELRSRTGKRIGFLDPEQFVPRFTTSLDAAASLVPISEIWWEVYYERGWERGPARVEICVKDEPYIKVRAFANTPAAALTAAALRARAQEASDDQ